MLSFYSFCFQLGEHVYSRESSANPSRLEAILAALLKAPVVTYASGLAAIHAALILLKPRRVSIENGYHGTHGVIAIHQRLTGCQKLPLDCEVNELAAGDVVWLETPVNPSGCARNIAYYAQRARARGAYLIVDSTFAPPPLQDPFRQGADMVMHSGTKYLGGHSDLLSGVLATKNKAWVSQLAKDRTFLGNMMGNLEAWLVIRSLRTLEMRVRRQSQNATDLVSCIYGTLKGDCDSTDQRPLRLSQTDVEVVYAAVADVMHASVQGNMKPSTFDWLQEQMPEGYGAVFAVKMRSEHLAKHLPSKLRLFTHATSLGGVESLVEWRTMSDATCEETLLRFSIGIENVQDLLNDLLQGLKQVV